MTTERGTRPGWQRAATLPLRGILRSAMSNVEIAQRFVDHWNETGEPPWDELDPDAVFVIDPESFVAGTYRGHEGIRTLLRLTAETFDQFRYEVDEWVDRGEAIVALGRIRVRGTQSGAAGTQAGAFVIGVRDGMIVSYRSYLRREEALEAAAQAMAAENVEIVRRFLRAGVDEALTYADPGIVWNPIEELPTTGHGAVRASLARWKAEWDDYRVIPEEFVDMGDSVLVTVCLRGRGRGSGVEIDARFYDVYTVRDRKIVRMDQFTERSEALEAIQRELPVPLFGGKMRTFEDRGIDGA
jgi:ketosteroid isomerase-like protein